MYWNPSINLLREMSEEDLAFINQRLDIVSADILKAMCTIELCGCCVVPDTKRYKVETDVNKFHLIEILVQYSIKEIFRVNDKHCVKSVRIWSFSGPYFPAFGLNTERYGVSFGIQSRSGKIQTRKLLIQTFLTQ